MNNQPSIDKLTLPYKECEKIIERNGNFIQQLQRISGAEITIEEAHESEGMYYFNVSSSIFFYLYNLILLYCYILVLNFIRITSYIKNFIINFKFFNKNSICNYFYINIRARVYSSNCYSNYVLISFS